MKVVPFLKKNPHAVRHIHALSDINRSHISQITTKMPTVFASRRPGDSGVVNRVVRSDLLWYEGHQCVIRYLQKCQTISTYYIFNYKKNWHTVPFLSIYIYILICTHEGSFCYCLCYHLYHKKHYLSCGEKLQMTSLLLTVTKSSHWRLLLLEHQINLLTHQQWNILLARFLESVCY